MENVKAFLRLQDNFDTHFQILFKGERRIHSIWSIIVSLMINIACGSMAITLLLELIKHSKPTVNVAKLNSPLTTNMTLNSKDLLYTIGLRNKYYQEISDPTIVRLIPTYERMLSINGILVPKVVELDIINCTNIYPFFEELGVGDRFHSTGLKDYNCFNGTSINEPVVLGGKYGTEFYGNLAFYVRKCVNGTNPHIICKPEEVINEAIQGGWLQITYVNSFIDLNNFSTPIQYITEDFYTNIDVNLNKIVYNYFNPVYFHSENNIIFSNENIQKVMKSDRQTTDINLSHDDGTLYTVFVCPSFTVEKYSRRYAKIQDIGASIGGFWSGLSIFGMILLKFIQLQHLQMKITNSLFDFVSDHVINPSDSIYHCKKYKEKKSSNTKAPFQVIKPRTYKINLGIINVGKIFICRCTHKSKDMQKQYNAIQVEVNKYIDFTKASRIFQDIDNIKALLINKNIANKWVNEKRIFNLSMDKKSMTTGTSQYAMSNNNILSTNHRKYGSTSVIPDTHSSDGFAKKPFVNHLMLKSINSDNNEKRKVTGDLI